jgi:hypothetical protein
MSDDVREFGYVLRYVHPLDGGTYYEVQRNGISTRSIGNANVFTLAQANARLRDLFQIGGAWHSSPPPREIVRVRRVPGEDKWEHMGQEEAQRFGYRSRSNGLVETLAATCCNEMYEPVKRIAGEPRWEVVDE